MSYLKLAVFAALVSLAAATVLYDNAASVESTLPVIDLEMIDKINNIQTHWTAGVNKRLIGMSRVDYRKLLGVPLNANDRPHKLHSLGPKTVATPEVSDLPSSFNSKENWPNCVTMNMILDQGHCGSCWAFGSAEAFSDRICISFGDNIMLSTEDLVACCDSCGDGCNGGYPESAYQYYQETGVVDAECSPYFDKEGCHHPGCTPEYPTPKCVRKCNNTESWSGAKRFGASTYEVSSNPEDIQKEIFAHGPVTAAFTVYEDFAHYTGGVYIKTPGSSALGGHAIEIVGWGTSDAGVDYWIVKNSWNTSWGMDGYFWIRRGTDECGIEDSVVAGLPKRN